MDKEHQLRRLAAKTNLGALARNSHPCHPTKLPATAEGASSPANLPPHEHALCLFSLPPSESQPSSLLRFSPRPRPPALRARPNPATRCRRLAASTPHGVLASHWAHRVLGRAPVWRELRCFAALRQSIRPLLLLAKSSDWLRLGSPFLHISIHRLHGPSPLVHPPQPSALQSPAQPWVHAWLSCVLCCRRRCHEHAFCCLPGCTPCALASSLPTPTTSSPATRCLPPTCSVWDSPDRLLMLRPTCSIRPVRDSIKIRPRRRRSAAGNIHHTLSKQKSPPPPPLSQLPQPPCHASLPLSVSKL